MAREASCASRAALANHPQVAERREQADGGDEKNHAGWNAGEHVAGLLPDNHTVGVRDRCQRKREDHECDVEASSADDRFAFVRRDHGGGNAGCDHRPREHHAAPLVEASSLGDGEGDAPRYERDKGSTEVANQHQPHYPGRRRDVEMLHIEDPFAATPWKRVPVKLSTRSCFERQRIQIPVQKSLNSPSLILESSWLKLPAWTRTSTSSSRTSGSGISARRTALLVL